jgi:hypothetical protein
MDSLIGSGKNYNSRHMKAGKMKLIHMLYVRLGTATSGSELS